jgi:hypothetical protein
MYVVSCLSETQTHRLWTLETIDTDTQTPGNQNAQNNSHKNLTIKNSKYSKNTDPLTESTTESKHSPTHNKHPSTYIPQTLSSQTLMYLIRSQIK